MNDDRNKSLFRQEALERLRSPDQLDRLFAPTTPVGWVALAAVLLLVFSTVIWSIFGVMATKVHGIGLIMDSAGMVNITSTAGGRLTELHVTVGDRVSKGQVVGIVAQPDIEAEIARITSDLETVKSRTEMAAMVAKLKELKIKLARDSQIISTYDGVIADEIVMLGDVLQPGSVIFNLRLDERKRGELMALLYVPVLEGKKVKPGMVVQIAPGSVNASEYGTLIGQVRSVSDYPVSSESVTGWTGNKELTAWIVAKSGGAVMEVLVDLIKDSETVTGYLWSSIHGAPEEISPGTACIGSIVVKRQAPISKAFLKLNQWLRSD